MRRAVRQYSRAVAWIAGFGVLSTIVGMYILRQQRLELPLDKRYTVRVELANANAVAPGLGQGVTVSGVRVGLISDLQVRQGRAIVTASIDPRKLPHVYPGATATLMPRTPLKDMELELTAHTGSGKPLADGAIVPLARTRVPLDVDDFQGALDADTRDYLQTLLSAAGIGLQDRGTALRAAFGTARPTFRQVRRINEALAARQRELARLVHNLGVLGDAAAADSPALARLVVKSDQTLSALARVDGSIQDSVALLPGTLHETRRALQHVRRFTRVATPAFRALLPSARNLAPAEHAVLPFLSRSRSVLRDELRPLVRTALPVAENLRPTVRRINQATPLLTTAMRVLQYASNELVNDPGKERSYLFWLAWMMHNANSTFSVSTVHGAFIRGMTIISCASGGATDANALIGLITGLASQDVCPKKAGR